MNDYNLMKINMHRTDIPTSLSFTPQERQIVGILSSIYSLRMLGLFMILPVFALYANELEGATPWKTGVALGIYGLTQAIFQIPFGYLSDRHGRKPLIIIGLLLFALGSLIAAHSSSMDGIIFGRALQGMGAIGSVIMALLSDLTRDEVRLRAMACIGITIGASFGLAFILGPVLSAWQGLQGIFWITAGLALVALMVVSRLKDPTNNFPVGADPCVNPVDLSVLSADPHVPSTDHSNHPAQRSIHSDPRAISITSMYAGVLILHASLTALFLKIPHSLIVFGYLANESWKFYLPVFLASLFSTIPYIIWMERIERKKGKKPLMMAVFFLAVSEVGILLLNKSIFGFAVSLWIFFTMFNILEASLPSYISKLAPQENKGTALGIFSALQFFGLFLGGFIGGALDQWGGLVTVVSFCIILALGWFTWIWTFKTRPVLGFN